MGNDRSQSDHDRAIVPIWMRIPRSVYVHIPFCAHRCGYCNFSLITGRQDLVPAFLQALEIELQLQTQGYELPLPIDTLFLGGGTPTYLNSAQRHQLLELLEQYFVWDPQHVEFSVESNPNDLNDDAVKHWCQLGANRFSLGVQSFQDQKLAVLERTHRSGDIHRAVQAVHRNGAALSLDLIFAAPQETLADWEADLKEALACCPVHLSTYQLTFEKGTQFWNRLQRGDLQAPEDTLGLQMYQRAIERLTGQGWQHYEVSNFALPGHASRHNCAYWQGRSYFAFGPAAARYLKGMRCTNHGSTTTYVRRLLGGSDPTAETEPADAEVRAREYLVFGMRMRAGVSRQRFHQETGWELATLCGDQIQQDVQQGWMVWEDDVLRLTDAGLMVSDSLWPYYL